MAHGPIHGAKHGARHGAKHGSLTLGSAGFATWTLTKTGGVHGNWDAEAYSNESFTGTTELQFTIATGGGAAFTVGLSADNPDADYTGIDFGFLYDAGTLYRSENGALTNLGAAAANDVLKIVRTAGTGAVTYFKNGGLVSTSPGTSVAALIVDSSFRFSNNSVSGLTVNGGASTFTMTENGVTAAGV
jgi:hypothetical protein